MGVPIELKEKRNKMLLQNKIKCNLCGDVLESYHRHDFKMCSCQKCGVDGGIFYLRRLGNIEDYTDLSIKDDGKWLTRRKYLKWGANLDKDGNLLKETEWRRIKHLETSHIEAILRTQHIPQIYKETMEEELKQRKYEQ